MLTSFYIPTINELRYFEFDSEGSNSFCTTLQTFWQWEIFLKEVSIIFLDICNQVTDLGIFFWRFQDRISSVIMKQHAVINKESNGTFSKCLVI